MNQKKIVPSMIQPMIDEVTGLQKSNEPLKDSKLAPTEGPLKPSELDQDPGGGFNPDHTYPQP